MPNGGAIIELLTAERDERRRNFFAFTQPGNLTPSQTYAWELEHGALRDLLEASQIRLDAELEMQALLLETQHG